MHCSQTSTPGSAEPNTVTTHVDDLMASLGGRDDQGLGDSSSAFGALGHSLRSIPRPIDAMLESRSAITVPILLLVVRTAEDSRS